MFNPYSSVKQGLAKRSFCSITGTNKQQILLTFNKATYKQQILLTYNKPTYKQTTQTGSKKKVGKKKKLPAGAVPIFGSTSSGSGLFDDDRGEEAGEGEKGRGRSTQSSAGGLFGESDEEGGLTASAGSKKLAGVCVCVCVCARMRACICCHTFSLKEDLPPSFH